MSPIYSSFSFEDAKHGICYCSSGGSLAQGRIVSSSHNEIDKALWVRLLSYAIVGVGVSIPSFLVGCIHT